MGTVPHMLYYRLAGEQERILPSCSIVIEALIGICHLSVTGTAGKSFPGRTRM